MLESGVHWLLERFRDMGYPGIVILMAMESSVLPLPSELVMPPAGYLAAKGELNLGVAIACGVLGSVLGALANYGVALWLGRAVIRRVGRYLFISERALDRAERFFDRHGEISTLLGRMLPVVRHLISIPAGIARMALPRFVLFTGLGALLWCSILATIGYVLGQHEAVLRNADVEREVSRALVYLIPALIVTVIVYAWRQRRRGTTKTP
ncbi:MAG TPA: DedA family protein [Gemmatimonadales bacterium]|nr:DedA family protein [Gemmatimonadales bacterium]